MFASWNQPKASKKSLKDDELKALKKSPDNERITEKRDDGIWKIQLQKSCGKSFAGRRTQYIIIQMWFFFKICLTTICRRNYNVISILLVVCYICKQMNDEWMIIIIMVISWNPSKFSSNALHSQKCIFIFIRHSRISIWLKIFPWIHNVCMVNNYVMVIISMDGWHDVCFRSFKSNYCVVVSN